ncbi:MAG: precorrin-8X methylmutase [Hyphomicrobiales bacterium]|nr:MAG: precorrin-8X methylmutase [Hyphomicrobiales bacterium]
MPKLDYIRDPKEIYASSFAIVRAESALGDLPEDMNDVAIRLIHSCGMPDILDDLQYSDEAVQSGGSALKAGATIFCDVEMVRAGIISRLLPEKCRVVCTLNDERVVDHAKDIANTRSAAAVDFWGEDLLGSVVVIGNAPTALFRLLERVQQGAFKPALIIGAPVGFVGAAESKRALVSNDFGLEYIAISGRRGGSAMASAIVNGLAGGLS